MESGDKKKSPRGLNHTDDEGGIKEKKVQAESVNQSVARERQRKGVYILD